MIKILLRGARGRMGRSIAEAVRLDKSGAQIAAGVDICPPLPGYTEAFPMFPSLSEVGIPADVIIDFTWHDQLPELLEYARRRSIPAVIATTGHTEEELAMIQDYSKMIAIFYSRNMSLGINLLAELVRRAAAALSGDFDVEIIERHHSAKLDAPSGTALILADAIGEALPYDPEYIYDRHAVRRERSAGEIGIHSVRGGTIVGDHEVVFAGRGEVITLSHSASSRDVFAAGAIRAARFLCGKPAGLYSMKELIGSTEG